MLYIILVTLAQLVGRVTLDVEPPMDGVRISQKVFKFFSKTFSSLFFFSELYMSRFTPTSAVQMSEAFLKDFHWLKLVHVDLFTLKVSTNEKHSFSKSDSLIGLSKSK